jgi:hypothetical protein
VFAFKFVGASGSDLIGNPRSVNDEDKVRAILSRLARPWELLSGESAEEKKQLELLNQQMQSCFSDGSKAYVIPDSEREILKQKAGLILVLWVLCLILVDSFARLDDVQGFASTA